MDRPAWWATVHGFAKELDTTYQLSMHILLPYLKVTFFEVVYDTFHLCIID